MDNKENPVRNIIYYDIHKMLKNVDLMELEGKSLLVTGASGLLGIYFLASIREINKNFMTPAQVYAIVHNTPEGFMYDLFEDKSIEFLQGDLTDRDFCESLPETDYIIHAAGYAQPGKFLTDPIKTITLNTEVTISLLKKLKVGGKFLFVSSAEVYSGLTRFPHKESEIGNTNTDHPRSCYIEGKRCGEAITQAYRKQGVNAKSARLALAYGPGTRKGDTRVLNTFIQKGFKGSIDLLDPGLAKRTYCYVADAVEIMWHTLLHGRESIYNVGGVSNLTIAELAGKVAGLTGAKVIIPAAKEGLAGAPQEVSLDLQKSEKEFGKIEFIDMNTGLANTVNWQRALYSGNQE